MRQYLLVEDGARFYGRLFARAHKSYAIPMFLENRTTMASWIPARSIFFSSVTLSTIMNMLVSMRSFCTIIKFVESSRNKIERNKKKRGKMICQRNNFLLISMSLKYIVNIWEIYYINFWCSISLKFFLLYIRFVFFMDELYLHIDYIYWSNYWYLWFIIKFYTYLIWRIF